MKQINLLPQTVRRKQIQNKQISVGFFAILAALFVVGSLWARLKIEVGSIQYEVTRTQNLAVSIGTNGGDPKAKAAIADISSRIDQLNTLSKEDLDWNRLFTLVEGITPKDVQLTGYSEAAEAGVITLKVGGTAPSNLSFANFMQTLSGDTTFTAAKVDSYAYDPLTGQVTFSLSLTLPTTTVSYSQGS